MLKLLHAHNLTVQQQLQQIANLSHNYNKYRKDSSDKSVFIIIFEKILIVNLKNKQRQHPCHPDITSYTYIIMFHKLLILGQKQTSHTKNNMVERNPLFIFEKWKLITLNEVAVTLTCDLMT